MTSISRSWRVLYTSALIVSLVLYFQFGAFGEMIEYHQWNRIKINMRDLVAQKITDPAEFRAQALLLASSAYGGAAHETLGELYWHLNEMVQSRSELTKASSETHFDYIRQKAQLSLIEQYFASDDPRDIENGIQLAYAFLENTPDHPAVLNHLAIYAFSQHNYTEAISFWEKIYSESNDWHLRTSLQQAILKAQSLLDPKGIVARVQVNLSRLSDTLDSEDILYLIVKKDNSQMPWIAAKFKVVDAINNILLLGDRMQLYSLDDNDFANLYIQGLISSKSDPLPTSALERTEKHYLSELSGELLSLDFRKGVPNE